MRDSYILPIPDWKDIKKMNDEVDDWSKEIWREIPNMYCRVSNFGRVKKLKLIKNGTARVCDDIWVDSVYKLNYRFKMNFAKIYVSGRMKTGKGKSKKPLIDLLLHRLVAMMFVPNKYPEKDILVNHMDGLSANALATNLEWCDRSLNYRHADNHSMIKKVKDNIDIHSTKHLKPEAIMFIRRHFMPYSSVYGLFQMSFKYKISYETIWKIVSHEIFTELPRFEEVNLALNGNPPINAYFYTKKKPLKLIVERPNTYLDFQRREVRTDVRAMHRERFGS